MPLYGLKFRTLGQTSYHSGPDSLRPGDQVIIAAEQGEALAEVVSGPHESLPAPYADAAQAILRPATAEDRERARSNAVLAQEAAAFCRQCIREIGCPAVTVEEGKAHIEPSLCFGCGLCAQICHFEAIKEVGSHE